MIGPSDPNLEIVSEGFHAGHSGRGVENVEEMTEKSTSVRQWRSSLA